MKKITTILLMIISFSLIAGSARPSTYFVNSATGNNANTPIQAKNIITPWQTVQFAIDNAAVIDGDNVVVAVGNYAGFTLTKRINIIGAWKGGMVNVNTIFTSAIILNAPGGNSANKILLKNLRVASTGNAIDVRSSFIQLENVFASSTGANANGLFFDNPSITDILIESCNFNNNTLAGINVPGTTGIDGLIIRNTTISNNGYFGIAAFQSGNLTTEIKNVEISHCAIVDNNITNQNQGHAVYFEKLKNAVIKNTSVVMPAGNVWIGINLNLSGRDDFSNISILNSRIIRSTPGSGIWVQARNDLQFPPAKLDTVVLRGNTFTNCDTNVAFNRNIKNITVDKCDLSSYTVYGLVNFTDADVINASNNKWKNGGIPDTTILSGGVLTSGSPVITALPNTNGIFIGMGIAGPGISPGSIVISKTPFTVVMSQPATSTGFVAPIGFVFNFAASTGILRTALNDVLVNNPLQNSIVNQDNISFPDVASAITGTNPGGTIWNLPNSLISGNTSVDKDLTLIGPGAGFLHSGSLTTFQNLVVSAEFTMGSDFAVSGSFTPGTTLISTDNTLSINGNIVAGGNLTGGPRSDLVFGGSGPGTTLRSINSGVRTLQISRASGITLATSMIIRRLLFLQSGILTIGASDLLLRRDAAIFNPFPTTSYVNTNGTGQMKKFFDNGAPTAFLFAVGAGAYSPVRVNVPDLQISSRGNVNVRVVNSKHPQNQCNTDFLKRYWVISENDMTGVAANLLFFYNTSDVTGTESDIYGAKWNGSSWTTFTPVDSANNTFSINGITSYGDFTGGALSCIGNFQTLINVKAFLEGAYTGINTMRTNLLANGLIPLSQPYDTTPFNYNGTETVTSIPANVVDWVYLELRSTASGTPLPNGRRAAFIKSDGMIVDLDGINPVTANVAGGDYFIIIGHRNHLPVMSADKQTLDTASILYDFTTGLTKYFGGDAASLGNNQYGLYAGDATKSFIITAADYTVVTNNLFTSGYNQGDINLTGIVTAADYTLITKNIFKSSNVPNYP